MTDDLIAHYRAHVNLTYPDLYDRTADALEAQARRIALQEKQMGEFAERSENDKTVLRARIAELESMLAVHRLAVDVDALKARIAELEAENAKLRLFRPYRTELTDCLKSMAVGDKSYYPAGDEYEKRRKTILRLAQLAGVKVKTRYMMKDKIEQISVERVG